MRVHQVRDSVLWFEAKDPYIELNAQVCLTLHIARYNIRCGAMDLSIELDVGVPQAHEAREKRLVHARVLLEGHVLNHGRELVVVPNEHHALEARWLPLCLRLVGGDG